MTVTVQRFLKSYPEFDEGTEIQLIQQKLNQAEARTGTAAWGDRRDEGVMLLCAHLLSVSPSGEKTRLNKNTNKTIYSEELDEMRRNATMGYGRYT